MGDVGVRHRELNDRYLDASRRLGVRKAAIKTPEQREAQILREQNMIMRAFIEDHGIEVGKVLAMEPAILSTKLTVRDVLVATAHHFCVSAMDIISERRFGYIMTARHAVFYLAKEMTPKSYVTIGRAIGGRDHTTVMYGCTRIERLQKTDGDLSMMLQSVRSDLLAKLYRES